MAKKTDNIEEEVSEEVVQAVANAIVEESNENDVQENLEEKETKNESLEEGNIVHKSTLNYRSRGFATEKDARNFIKTDYFKKLGEADKEEFMAWLEK